MTTELSPCPWCGVEPVVMGVAAPRWFYVRCNALVCPVRPSTIEFRSKRGAVNAWNRRKPAKKRKAANGT